MVFPGDEEEVIVLPFFWAPRENAPKRERNDRAPYLTWARQEYLELTDGEVTDYSFILHRIEELAQTYQIREIAFDRFGAVSEDGGRTWDRWIGLQHRIVALLPSSAISRAMSSSSVTPRRKHEA